MKTGYVVIGVAAAGAAGFAVWWFYLRNPTIPVSAADGSAPRATATSEVVERSLSRMQGQLLYDRLRGGEAGRTPPTPETQAAGGFGGIRERDYGGRV